MGAELCLAHDIGGWRHWGPLSVDMQPYGCFIINGIYAEDMDADTEFMHGIVGLSFVKCHWQRVQITNWNHSIFCAIPTSFQ